MALNHIEHIGIAVRDLEASIALYETLLGTSCSGIEEVPDQKVRTAFFRVGETKIELLASTSPEGPIAKHIEKRGEGIHHIAFSVDDVGQALTGMASAGLQLVDREPRPGAEGLLIGFLHPRATHGVLVELCGPR